jgi:hypothetical protein
MMLKTNTTDRIDVIVLERPMIIIKYKLEIEKKKK